MSALKQAPAKRRLVPSEYETVWTYDPPWRGQIGWRVNPGGDISVWTDRRVDHARGRRSVIASIELDTLLDTLAATKVGRRAMLDALVRHES